jgi:hypothetical protein
MNNFTSEDFANMVITKMSYNEETRGWTFFVRHNDFTYSIKDFDLPHPDDVANNGYLVSVVQQKMLTVENKSAKEIVKQIIEVQEDTILYTPLDELEAVEYIKVEEPQLLEYDGPGYIDFFLDDFNIYKGNINIILNLNSNTWIPGKYMKSFEWIQMYSYRLANIKGNKIKLFPLDRRSETKQGTWEYWDGSSLNTLEYNGVITREMVIGGGDGSKYNVHFILDTDTMTWNYGPNNVDSAWIGQGKQIYIQGIKVSLGIKRTENGYTWEYL